MRTGEIKSDEVHVAYTKLICPECKNKICIGHPYVYRLRQVENAMRLERIHPECKGKSNG